MTRLGQGRFGLMVAMLLVGGAVGVAGCNTGSTLTDDEEIGQGEAAVQEAADEEEAVADEASEAAGKHGKHGKHGKREHGRDHGDRGRMGRMGHGPDMLFMAALNELELSDTQRKTIESALEGLRKDRPEPPAAHEDMRARSKALAEAIRANSVDADALTPKAAEMPDFEKGRQKLTAAIKTLHDTLTSDQRTALVASIKDKGPKGGEKMGRPNKKGGRHGGDFVGMLLHGVDVDEAQRTKIAAALTAAGLSPSEDKADDREQMHEQMKAKMEAALDAFQKDVFVADDVIPAPPAKMMHGPAPKDFVKALEIAVPLLTAEQRDALADRIEAGPPGRHGKGKMGARKEAN